MSKTPPPPKDKRTKAYKEWKAKYDADGLGSKIEKITEKTGIKKVVKFLAGEDCGCDERKEKLNRAFRHFNCLKEYEFNYLTDLFAEPHWPPKPDENIKTLQIHNRVFGRQQKPSGCAPCIRSRYDDLKRVLDAYD